MSSARAKWFINSNNLSSSCLKFYFCDLIVYLYIVPTESLAVIKAEHPQAEKKRSNALSLKHQANIKQPVELRVSIVLQDGYMRLQLFLL